MCSPFLLIFIVYLAGIRIRYLEYIEHERWLRTFHKMVWFVAFVMYPGMCIKIFWVFKCTSVGVTPYLTSDVSIVCYEGSHIMYMAIAGAFIFLYVLAPVIFMIIVVYRKREDIKQNPYEPLLSDQYGTLYLAYRNSLWFGEAIEMLRKLLLFAC